MSPTGYAYAPDKLWQDSSCLYAYPSGLHGRENPYNIATLQVRQFLYSGKPVHRTGSPTLKPKE
ncbi:hypothetical protein [Nostoc sp. T09]|uniref:hypothetical protein n=1 Tax=Nostoc sp. T09 TaxID=1932621 RepID=UPI00117D25B7|nr:hypothetical protein [Nostoc sp. T09]